MADRREAMAAIDGQIAYTDAQTEQLGDLTQKYGAYVEDIPTQVYSGQEPDYSGIPEYGEPSPVGIAPPPPSAEEEDNKVNQRKLYYAIANLANYSRRQGRRANQVLGSIPMPGGIGVPLAILGFLFLALIPVNGHVRLVWLWLAVLGQAEVDTSGLTGATVSAPITKFDFTTSPTKPGTFADVLSARSTTKGTSTTTTTTTPITTTSYADLLHAMDNIL